jgi:N-acetyl sugar amidotransferase
MDTTDPEIVFDERGICNHCRAYDANAARFAFSPEERQQRFDALVARMRQEGQGKDYDCVIGLSGGVDSSYVAHLLVRQGVRPLAVHLDNGWNSELAVKNIENLVTKLGIDLITHVVDWEEFRDLQLAFLRASTPDSEIPSDHAIVALLCRTAVKHRIRFMVTGRNYQTESHLPRRWSSGHLDWKYIRGLNRRFGGRPLRTFPHVSVLQLSLWLATGRLEWVDLLNLVDYDKERAIREMEEALGWKYYGGKHYESIYTRFYQGYILPRKFGFDKRKTHLSSLICSGRMSREEALEELKKPPYPEELQREDREYATKKFGLTEQEFEGIMQAPPKDYRDYPHFDLLEQGWYRWGRTLYRRLRSDR